MREDMAKLLVERPRLNGGMKFPRGAEGAWRRVPLDERPRCESLKKTWHRQGGSLKMLNENLAPLYRFLRSRIGRRWDEVYSEICQRINRDCAVQLHIWQHLMWSVIRNPVDLERLGRYGSRNSFYVDPATGLLQEIPNRWSKRSWNESRRAAIEPLTVVFAGRHYKQIDEIWYEIEFAPIPDYGQIWEAILRKWIILKKGSDAEQRNELRWLYGASVYAARKQQIGKHEIRRLVKASIIQNNR